MTWFDERLHTAIDNRGYMQRFEVTRTVYHEKTEHQDLIIFETSFFGRVLALDGVVQTTEKDEFFYHEMMAHVPVLAHGGVRDVLIVGGGDGGILREVLRHPMVDRATLVELDRTVIDLCQEHMPGLSDGAFDDGRSEVVIADGVRFMAESAQTYDLILIDSTDPMGPGEVLFTESFYGDCKARLRPGGILVTQCGVPFFQGPEVTTSHQRMAPHFRDVGFYSVPVPTYVGGLMTLGWGCDDETLRQQPLSVLQERFRESALATRYYSPEIHTGAFSLPPYISSLIP